jgi:hypothetical protein
MTSTGAPPAPAAIPTPRSRRGLVAGVAVIVVLLLVVAGLYAAKLGPFAGKGSSGPSGSSAPPFAGGFTDGELITINFTGPTLCTPSLTSFYTNQSAAAAVTNCEVGEANQNALAEYPQWLLVPAFAGLGAFGLSAYGGTADGYGVFSNQTVYTDCGAGASPTACADTPPHLYSPTFASIERDAGQSSGVGGKPLGVLPAPSEDTLLNTSPAFPSTEWGSIIVFVFDPDIFPDRLEPECAVVVASNLTPANGNCLTSFAALERALSTYSSSVLTANGNNPVWRASGSKQVQALIVGGAAADEATQLNANLYYPYSTEPGAPSSFPS